MAEHGSRPVIKKRGENTYHELSEASGVSKTVILAEEDGAPNFRMRRYQLDPGAEVPKHTNQVEHEVHALSGEYIVGLDNEEHVVSEGDSLLIPPGTVHWFRNDTDEESAFLCMVPIGDADIELVDSAESDH